MYSSSALQATLEALLFTSYKRLQNWRCVFSICELSLVLKIWFGIHTPYFTIIFHNRGDHRIAEIRMSCLAKTGMLFL